MKILYRLFVLLFVFVETLTLFQGYVPFREWIPLSFMCGISLLMYPKAFLNKSTLYLVLYCGILMLFAVMGHDLATPKWVLIEILVLLSCLSITHSFAYNRDMYGLKMVTVLGLCIIGVTALLTLPIVTKNPDAVRNMVGYTIKGNNTQIQSYLRQGIASFGLVHAFPLLCPLLVLNIKTAKNYLFRALALAVILVTYFMLLKASFGTPLLLATAAIALGFLLTKNQLLNIVIVLCMVASLFLTMNKNLVVYVLEEAQELAFSKTPIISKKIDDIVASIKFNKSRGEISGREKVYERSWSTFFSSPLWGSSEKRDAGGHAYFPDRLAYFGLLGTVPFFLFLYYTLKKSYLLINSKVRLHFQLGVTVFILLGLLKNVTGVENFLYLFVFLPGLALFAGPDSLQQPEQSCLAGEGGQL